MRAPHAPARSRTIIVISLAALLATGSLFGALYAMTPKPGVIKARLQAELDLIRKLPAGDLARKDRYYEELLADPEWNRFPSLRKQAEKEHAAVHEALRVEKQAAQDVPPFLRRIEIARATPKEFAAQAPQHRDEARTLWERYAATRFGPALDALHRELGDVITSTARGPWEPLWVPLQRDAELLKVKGDFSEALRLLEEFGVRHAAAEDLSLAQRIQRERESVARESEGHVRKLERRAKELLIAGRRDEIRKFLEDARPGLLGLPAAAKLEALLSDMIK